MNKNGLLELLFVFLMCYWEIIVFNENSTRHAGKGSILFSLFVTPLRLLPLSFLCKTWDSDAHSVTEDDVDVSL